MPKAQQPIPDREAADPILDGLPRYITRVAGAKAITERYFETSPRTLEDWPLPSRLINGRAHYDTAELLAHARSLMEAAPPPRLGGRKAAQGRTAR